MKASFTSFGSWAARWSEAAVGSWPRYLFLVAVQIGGFILLCRQGNSQIGLTAFFVLIWPLMYLSALRGVSMKLRQTSKPDETTTA